jgi:hypothetical protein
MKAVNNREEIFWLEARSALVTRAALKGPSLFRGSFLTGVGYRGQNY